MNKLQVRLINPKLRKIIFLIISVRVKKLNLESKIMPKSFNWETSSILEPVIEYQS